MEWLVITAARLANKGNAHLDLVLTSWPRMENPVSALAAVTSFFAFIITAKTDLLEGCPKSRWKLEELP